MERPSQASPGSVKPGGGPRANGPASDANPVRWPRYRSQAPVLRNRNQGGTASL